MPRLTYAKPERCPEDGGEFELMQTSFGALRQCKSCTVRQWLDVQGNPKGTPANAFLRRARMEAHRYFDALWKSGFMKREEAYAWLSAQLRRDEVHMAEMDTIECALVTKISKQEVDRRKALQSNAARARG